MVDGAQEASAGPGADDEPWTPLPMDPPQPMLHHVVPQRESRFKRRYERGLFLAVVTLGVYALWWHWAVHKELSGYLGRPMRGQEVWLAYATLYVAVVLLVSWVWLLRLGVLPGGDEEVSIAVVGAVPFPATIAVLLSPIALVLFIIYIRRQYETVREAKLALGIPMRTGSGRFLLLYVAGMVLSPFPMVGFAAVLLAPLAYWYLQEHYNEVWDAVDEWRSRPVEQAQPTTSPFPR